MPSRKDAPSPSLAKLRTEVRTAPSPSARNAALDALVERSTRRPTTFLADVAGDETVDLDVRLKAVGLLGATPTDASVRGLTAALKSPSQPVVRRAAERLGALPGTEQLAALKDVRTGNAVTRDALRWAKLQVSYRNRLGEYTLPTSFPRVEPDPIAADHLRVAPLRPAEFEELDALVDHPVLGLRLTARGAARFECGSRSFVGLVTRDFARGGPDWLREGQAMPGVLMQRSRETGQFVASHVILSDPDRRARRIRIRVARRSGAVVLAGQGSVDGDAVSFALAATTTPYLPPTSVSGRVDATTGALEIDQLITSQALSAGQASMRRVPTRQTSPASR